MKEFTYIIQDENGLHARPAGLFVNKAKELGVPVTITKEEKTVDGTRLISVMGLGIKKGDRITIVAGNETAAAELSEFCEANF